MIQPIGRILVSFGSATIPILQHDPVERGPTKRLTSVF
jgi:hypothetical protein